MKTRFKLRKLSLLIAAFSVVVLYNNCSGFSAQKFASVTSASDGSSGAVTPPALTTPPVPNPAANKTRVFVAQGKLLRTAISCDGGHTWIHDQSFDNNLRCWLANNTDPRYVECDHDPRSSVGVDSGDGYIYTNWGWGYAGSVRRSADGNTWQTIATGGWGGGVSYALGKLLLLWRSMNGPNGQVVNSSWFTSSDQGTTWDTFATQPPAAIIADHAHAFRLGAKYAIVANSGIAISSDAGQTWVSTPNIGGWPPNNIAEGNGVIVAIGNANQTYPAPNTLHAMRSTDAGQTWSDVSVTSAQYIQWSQILFDGTQFVAYSNSAQRWTSPDGLNWTATPIVATGDYTGGATWVTMGAIAYNEVTRTYVSITTEWGYWYDKQRAYVSNDGINWTMLDSAHFTGGHPIAMIKTADIDSNFCP